MGEWVSRWRWTLVGLLFGCVLFIFGLGAAGMAHGTYLPLYIYGAPLSAVPLAGLLVTPVWWTALGWAISSRRRTVALGLLAAHIIGATLFVIFGTPMEPGEDQWIYFDRMQTISPVLIWGGLASYAAMLILFLYVALSIRRKSTA
jgi:hypothetical protein